MTPYSRHFVRLLCLAFITLATIAPNLAWAEAAATNTVAVLDFTLKGASSSANNWAIGLADFFTMELQQRNVVMLERRDIRYLLSERQLSLAGAMAKDALVRQSLPSVKYLVQGNVQVVGESRFSLVVGVVDARSGLELHSFEASGAYPSDWVKAIGKLAGQIATALGGTETRSENVPFGFTSQPELALRFYQGVAHCLDGRPELGLSTFIDLRSYDKKFLLCWIWEMRAWEMMGLKDHARVAEEEFLALPIARSGELALELALCRRHASNQVVVAVSGYGQPTAQSRAAVERLKQALLASSGIKVFNPDYIREISQEKDLHLTGEFTAQGEKEVGNWLAVDAIVTVEPLAAGNQLRVVVRDGLSGKAIFTQDINPTANFDALFLESLRKTLFDTSQPVTNTKTQLAGNEQFWENLIPKNLAKIRAEMTPYMFFKNFQSINPVFCHAYFLHQAITHPEKTDDMLVLRDSGFSSPHSALFRKQYLAACARQRVSPRWDPTQFEEEPDDNNKTIDKNTPDFQLAVSMTNLLNQAEQTNGSAAIEIRLKFLNEMTSHWNSFSNHAVICLQRTGRDDWLAMQEYPKIYVGFIDAFYKLKASQLTESQRAELKRLTCQFATDLSKLQIPPGHVGLVCETAGKILDIVFDLYLKSGCYDEALALAQRRLNKSRQLMEDQHHINWARLTALNQGAIELPAYRERMWRVNAVMHMARVLNEAKGALARAEFVAAEQAQYEKDYLVDSPVDEKLMPTDPIGEDYALAQMAAEYWDAAGQIDQSIKVLTHVYGSDRYCLQHRMNAALDLAGYKGKNGNINEALDLYREVSDKSPRLEKEALKRMNLLRNPRSASEPHWGPPRPTDLPAKAPAAPVQLVAEVQKTCQQLYRFSGNFSAPQPTGIMDKLIKAHGTNLIPALIKEYLFYVNFVNDDMVQLKANLALFKKVIQADTNATVPIILDAFRSNPQLAPVAFLADPQGARAIVDKELPALLDNTYYVRWNLARTIIEQRLTRHYPFLIACIGDSGHDTSHARHKIIKALSEAITPAEPAALREAFENAIKTQTSVCIEAAEAALKRRMRAGVEGATVGFTQFTPEKLTLLRRFIKLPASDDEAIAFLKQKPEKFEWLPQ